MSHSFAIRTCGKQRNLSRHSWGHSGNVCSVNIRLVIKDALDVTLSMKDTDYGYSIRTQQIIEPDILEAGNRPRPETKEPRVFEMLRRTGFRHAAKGNNRVFHCVQKVVCNVCTAEFGIIAELPKDIGSRRC